MKSFLNLVFVLFISANAVMSQIIVCDPNPLCDEPSPGEGAICPDELLPACINQSYEAVFTVIPLSQYSGNTIHSIRVDDIDGLPSGITWGKNENIFLVTVPLTRYCILIYGTPLASGDYPLDIYVTPYVYYYPPFGNPIVIPGPQQVFQDTVSMVVIDGEPPIASFNSDYIEVETGQEVNFYCQSTGEITSRSWLFENGTPSQSNEINPVVIWNEAGTFSVSLKVDNACGSNILLIENYISVNNSFIPGDSNGDGIVNVLDIITTVNYIMGINPEPFVFQNADVNNDGNVDVLDVIGTVNNILGEHWD